jgi:hypothetical protein
MSAATGHVTAFDPQADGYVYSLVPSAGVVYAAGDYLRSEARRSRLAALDPRAAWPPHGIRAPPAR